MTEISQQGPNGPWYQPKRTGQPVGTNASK